MNQDDDFIFTVRVSITVIAAFIAIFVALVFGKEKDDDE
tara:strand:- start:284 stop:400 length:117 start_codon:yes stop_codon:yes gene_type:complete